MIVKLPRTHEISPRVEWHDALGSTNAELRELLLAEHEAVPHGTVCATADQTAGKGRAGRGWTMPPGTALAISVLIRGFGAQIAPGGSGASGALSPGWLPLLAGSAVTAALQPFFGPELRVGTKWPNDVHVRDEEDAEAGRPGKKLSGILCEMVSTGKPSEHAIIVGMGINVLIPEWELPTERAGSVLASGGDLPEIDSLYEPAGEAVADEIIAKVVAELLRLVALAETDPAAAKRTVLKHSLTLNTEVRVHLPGGDIVDGRAIALDTGGELIVDLPTGGRLTVSAADVEHLR